MTIRYSPESQSWLLMAGPVVIAESVALSTLQTLAITPEFI